MTDIREELAAALEALLNDATKVARNSFEAWDGKKFVWNDAVWAANDEDGLQLAIKARAALSRHRAAKEAEGDVRAILFPEPREENGVMISADASYNLNGALYDLRALEADPVCIRTIERVVDQLEQVRAALTKARPHD